MNEGIEGLERPLGAAAPELGYGSDAAAEVLRRLGLEYTALVPGASFRGLHDSLVNYLGNRAPQIVLALHEEAAVAIAHGYAKVTERPMAVALHSNVGLMHASMAIFNAWCDRVPMLVIGATGAVDAARRRPWIEWIHTAADQAALVRHFVKWDDQPASVAAAIESLLRAHQLATTLPRAPVYVCLDVSLQEDPLAEPPALPDVSRYRPAAAPEPAAATVAEIARHLQGARRPLILAGRVSRSETAWDQRVRLAEALGARVVTDLKAGAAFPTRHPLHACPPSLLDSPELLAVVGDADVVLSLDWIDPAGTLKSAWGGAEIASTVIQCSLDSLVHGGWSMDYQGLAPVDVALLADPDTLVAALLDLVEGAAEAPEGERTPVREAPPAPASGPIGLRDLASALDAALAGRPTCLVRLPLGWPGEACDFRGPLDYLGLDGGAGIGSGPGMAVGAALALKDSGRLAVAVLGDGDYLMGMSALWSAARYRLPLLVVTANNRSFYNDEVHQERVANTRARPVENRWIGQKIDDPAPDLAALARGLGLAGEGPVSDIAELGPALARGVAAAAAGKAHVVDVVVRPGYEGNVSFSDAASSS